MPARVMGNKTERHYLLGEKYFASFPFSVGRFSSNNSVGPVSSLHDRACELFYSLVGGKGGSCAIANNLDGS